MGSCEPLPASGGKPHRPPKATKNTTGVMFEPSQGVLEASRGVPTRPCGLQECPRAFWCIPNTSRNVLRSFLEGSQALISTILRLLETSGTLRNVSRGLQRHSATLLEASRTFRKAFRVTESLYEASRTLLEPLRRYSRHPRTPSQPTGRFKVVMHLGTRSEG